MLNLIFVGLQVLLPFLNRKKIGDLEEVYWGFEWGSYTREAVVYILDYLGKNPHFMKDLCWCKIPEELCFQTILMQSHMRRLMVNDNKRFWDMGRGDGSGPAYLELSNIDEMEKSGAVFARKVRYGSPVSTYLKKKRMDREQEDGILGKET